MVPMHVLQIWHNMERFLLDFWPFQQWSCEMPGERRQWFITLINIRFVEVAFSALLSPVPTIWSQKRRWAPTSVWWHLNVPRWLGAWEHTCTSRTLWTPLCCNLAEEGGCRPFLASCASLRGDTPFREPGVMGGLLTRSSEWHCPSTALRRQIAGGLTPKLAVLRVGFRQTDVDQTWWRFRRRYDHTILMHFSKIMGSNLKLNLMHTSNKLSHRHE